MVKGTKVIFVHIINTDFQANQLNIEAKTRIWIYHLITSQLTNISDSVLWILDISDRKRIIKTDCYIHDEELFSVYEYLKYQWTFYMWSLSATILRKSFSAYWLFKNMSSRSLIDYNNCVNADLDTNLSEKNFCMQCLSRRV